MAERVAGVVTAVYGPLVRVQAGEDALVVPARRRLHWPDATDDRRLVVGDHVYVEGSHASQVVAGVEARRTTLSRRSPGENRSRVIAANVDQAVVVTATVSPEPNLRLIDRLLVACHHAGIAPVLCVNKVDQGTDGIDAWIGDYQDCGYTILLVSARTARGMGSLKRLVADRTTLFCGPSGVGKSALLNAIHPGYRLVEGSISEATGKGKHTTSTAQLLTLPSGGFVVDTPGVKEFGLWDLAPARLAECFPDLARFSPRCAFASCGHAEEPDCAVRNAAQRGTLSSRRYTSFLKLWQELVDTPER